MRLSHVFLVAAATLLASCCTASAATQTKLSRETAADHVQPVKIDSPSKRFLRTTETAAAVKDDEDEERAFQVQFLNKLKLPTFFGSPVRKDGTFTKAYVKALLKNKKLQRRTFQDWATANLDANILRESLGGLTDKYRVQLFNRYTAYTGELVRRPGDDLVGEGWKTLARDVAK